jgi:hypothetical protein
MATTTPNFSWPVPTSTDLVKDGATAIEALGDSIDASLVDLKGGTSGQVLAKNSGTDMDFIWVTDAAGDITSVNTAVTSGLTGGATSGAVDLSLLLNFNAQVGTTYTLVATDLNKLVTTSNSSPITVTIPPSVFSAGQQINLQSIGVGLTTFAAGAGVTITSTGASVAAPKLRARYSACTIICTASNVFTVLGDIS